MAQPTPAPPPGMKMPPPPLATTDDVAVEMHDLDDGGEPTFEEAEAWGAQEIGLSTEQLLLVVKDLIRGLVAEGRTVEEARKEAYSTVMNDSWRMRAVESIRDQQELNSAFGRLIEENEPLFLRLCQELKGTDQLEDEQFQEVVADWVSREAELLDVCNRLASESPYSPVGLTALESLVNLRERRGGLHQVLLPFFDDLDEDGAEAEAKHLGLSHPRPEGMRVDDENGMAYCRDDFILQYGEVDGQARWETAQVQNGDWRSLHADMAARYPTKVAELHALFTFIEGHAAFDSSRRSGEEPQEEARDLHAPKQNPPLVTPELVSPEVGEAKDTDGGLTREQWLYENAAHARLYHSRTSCGCWQLCQEVFATPGFRIYITVILYSTAALTLVGVWQSVLDVLTRLFLPREGGTWQSIGVFAVLVMLAFFVGAWATQVLKTIRQWVLLTDDLFFSDKDYRDDERTRERVRSKVASAGSSYGWFGSPSRLRSATFPPIPPPPAALQPLLPPKHGKWAYTFWGLPTGGCMRREVYLMVLIFATTVVPVIYAGARIAVDGEDMYSMLGHFAMWNLVLGVMIVAALSLNARYLSIRLKYAAYIDHSKSDIGPWNRNPRLLAEWGLDQASVARNLAVLALALLPLLVMWWLVSRSELQLSEEWIVLGILICLLMLAVREAVRSSGTAERAPYVAAALWLIFVVLGISATAQISGTAAVLFVVGTVITGGVELRHGSSVSGSSVMPQTTSDPAAPLNPLAHPAERSAPMTLSNLRSAATAHGFDLVPKEEGETKQWLPCSRVFSAMFSCPCYGCSVPEEPAETGWKPPVSEQHWRLTKHWYNDPSRLASSLSAPVMLWSLLSVVIAGGCVLGVAGELRQPLSKFSLPETAPQSWTGSYPICKMRWRDANRLSIVDFAMLADLSYAENGAEWTAGFNSRFNNSGWEVVFPEGPSQRVGEVIQSDFGEDEGASSISWVHLYHHPKKQHILVLRSNLEGRHLMRDLSVWGRSASVQLLGILVPPVRVLTDQLTAALVGGLGFIGLTLDDGAKPVNEISAPLVQFAQRLTSGDTALTRGSANVTEGAVQSGPVTLVGHGTDGGFAAVVAARLGLRSVTFGAPGTQWVRQDAGLSYPSPTEVSVIASQDPLAKVDKHTGGVQVIECRRDSISECHNMREIACELTRRCGDPSDRGLDCS
eukprot:Hpha_TRINITY_DN15522_c1_g4::TRINITY_DN15522_c1_g4_i1::g.108079::m.108079